MSLLPSELVATHDQKTLELDLHGEMLLSDTITYWRVSTVYVPTVYQALDKCSIYLIILTPWIHYYYCLYFIDDKTGVHYPGIK